MKKISFQKIFCLVSILFILSCIIFYGTRFIRLYKENKKEETIEANTLAKVIKDNNNDNSLYKKINGEYYFTGSSDNNYLEYSNIIWRIIKIDEDNNITAISNNALTSLAFGNNVKYQDSYVNKWLNKSNDEYTGILESSLNDISSYLVHTTTCNDVVDELTNDECTNISNDNYLTILSVADYLNIGSKDSYLNNEEYYYLSNTNKDNKVWYVGSEGKISASDGTDIIGIKPVITIKANIDYQSGDGKETNPYKIENKIGLFGSYVLLDNTMWRIYKVNDNYVRLVMNDYLKVDGENLTYQYGASSSYFNDTKYGSIAYYLNHTYLNTLSYKDKIKEVKWPNGYYNNSTNYDYTYSLKTEIDSKITLLSIGDIILNPNLTNYFTMTGGATNNQGYSLYVINKDKMITPKQISNELNVVPTISVDKSLLTKGTGTYDNPLEME